MKHKKESFEEGRPAFYAHFLNEFRSVALMHGYMLTVHGSLARDLDIIAVPWIEEVAPVEELVKAISECLDETPFSEFHLEMKEERPHNRIIYTLPIAREWFIDFSIIQPENTELWKKKNS